MSWHAYKEPECVNKPGPVALTIKPRPRESVPLQGDIDMFSEAAPVRGKA